MVYEIAKEMGYGLMVESTQGKGSTFTISSRLPASRKVDRPCVVHSNPAGQIVVHPAVFLISCSDS
jgi:hypothetical protein